MAIRPTGTRWTVTEPSLSVATTAGEVSLAPKGDWTLAVAGRLEALVSESPVPKTGSIVLDLGNLDKLDTAGALILNRLLKERVAAGHSVNMLSASEAHRVLIEEVHARDRPSGSPVKGDPFYIQWLVGLGQVGHGIWVDVRDITMVLGGVAAYLARWIVSPGSVRIHSTTKQLQRMALEAVPIVALMSFLIGAIIAQQGAYYFRRFGAELYVIDMVGVLTLRELGVLLTAIMVAGRSGSSITAEIGSMKMREEVDAMRVIGLDPIEVLILPRIVALVIALPLLTFLSDVAGIIGGAMVAVTYMGLPIESFIQRLSEAVTVDTLKVGLIKAPFMALIIGLISCVEGMQVKGSAESLGSQTTVAVVKSIFMVVVLDGLFAIFFTAVGI